MWTSPDSKPRATPELFDLHYSNPHRLADFHLVDVLSLTGRLERKKVLDLGGGTLLAEGGTARICDYTLVDFSSAVCHIVREREPRAIVIRADVRDFLQRNSEVYDVVLCMGLIEYLPPRFLHDLLALAPSENLVIGTSASEAYLQYPGRITVYSSEEIEQAAFDAGWRQLHKLPMMSHHWASYHRLHGDRHTEVYGGVT